MIALDASVLIAYLYPRDAHHAAATELLVSWAHAPLLAHPLTLAEVLVSAAKVGRGAEMLEDLMAIGMNAVRPLDGEALRLANLRATTGLKLPDCCVLDTALINTAQLATFDAGLARAAREFDVPLLP